MEVIFYGGDFLWRRFFMVAIFYGGHFLWRQFLLTFNFHKNYLHKKSPP